MSNIKNYIFNKKILDRLLEKVVPEDLKIFSKFKNNLKGYSDRITSGKIYKFSELEFQETFLTEIFECVLGYTYIIHADDVWNLRREQTTRLDSSKPDAIIGFGGFDKGSEADVRGVIELKSAGTDLDSKQSGHGNQTPVEQAFSYASKFGKNCRWVIVSNFIEIRLYSYSDQGEYETFDLREMDDNYEEFQRFYFLLHKGNLIKKDGLSRIDKLYQENTEEEEKISQKFYQEYKQLRIHLFQHIRNNNPDIEPLTALEKTQKVIDRFIFVCFCEDKGLLEDRIFRYIIEHTTPGFSKWDAVKGLFRAINKGDPNNNINKFNGGLFEDDEILDQQIKLDDEIFEEMARITDWDFDSELNVNILGHIFEKSISDIEELKAEIEGEIVDKKKGKRKKEGIYYTPDYITKYIVENAVGGWLEDRKKELNIDKLPELVDKDFESIKIKKRKIESNARIKKHLVFWEAYKQKLMNIKVLDPACGSGAFLNQAFDYLYKEGQKVNENISRLQGGQMTIFDLDKHILTNNIFGVDLNSESVEITKLSMWLKTANKGKELTFLDDNIKCGNSLIDDEEVAGDQAFKWEEEFKEIMVSGGFDVVIGNPPYVVLSPKIFLAYTYTKGNNNTYVAFVEKSLAILKISGILSFIIPNTWFSGDNFETVRKKILTDYNLQQIIQLPYDIFNAYIDTSIVIIKNHRSTNNTLYYKYNIRDYQNDINIQKLISFPSNEWLKFNKIFLNIQLLTLGDKVWFSSRNVKLGKISKVNRGSLPPKDNEKSQVQSEYYNIKWFDDQVFRYMIKKKTNSEVYVNYKNLRENKNIEVYNSKKIIARQLMSRQFRMNITYLDEPYAFKKNLYAIYDLDKKFYYYYLLTVLNSKLFSFVQVNFNTSLQRDDFPAFSLKDFRNFPITRISKQAQQQFVEKAEIMLLLNKELQERKNKFLNRINDNFGIEKLSNKLNSFYDHDFKTFISELKKKKVKLSLSQQEEWEEYFNQRKTEINILQKQIDKTDKEIDQMVYELYGLTEEEIKIVEDI